MDQIRSVGGFGIFYLKKNIKVIINPTEQEVVYYWVDLKSWILKYDVFGGFYAP